MNLNYENFKNTTNLMEMSFLKEDINQILNNNDINQKFKKIMSIYDIMSDRSINVINFNHNNEQITEVQPKKILKAAMKSNLKLK